MKTLVKGLTIISCLLCLAGCSDKFSYGELESVDTSWQPIYFTFKVKGEGSRKARSSYYKNEMRSYGCKVKYYEDTKDEGYYKIFLNN